MTTASKTDATKDVPKANATEAPKEAKAAKKSLTDGQKLRALIKAAKENGWSLPDEVHDED